jgi:ubiquinone biosynthesis protein COQ9
MWGSDGNSSMAPVIPSAYIAAMAEAADWAVDTEARLLDAALPHVGALGWTSRLVRRAAGVAGLTPAEAGLLLPQGARDLATLLSYRQDEAAMAALSGVDPAGLKMRERIARGVQARVAAAMTDETASRRLMGFLALPQNLALGARLAWESADRIWRWAGDAATDENHFSKRAILAALLTSTLAVRLSDASAADQHLARGIEAVMAYERAKAKFRLGDPAATVAAFLGRIRHGRRPTSGPTRA